MGERTQYATCCVSNPSPVPMLGNCTNRAADVCVDLTVCTSGQYQSVAPNATRDRECVSISPPCRDNEYQAAPPTTTSDRQCENQVNCGSNEFERVAATPTSVRECEDCGCHSNAGCARNFGATIPGVSASCSFDESFSNLSLTSFCFCLDGFVGDGANFCGPDTDLDGYPYPAPRSRECLVSCESCLEDACPNDSSVGPVRASLFSEVQDFTFFSGAEEQQSEWSLLSLSSVSFEEMGNSLPTALVYNHLFQSSIRICKCCSRVLFASQGSGARASSRLTAVVGRGVHLKCVPVFQR